MTSRYCQLAEARRAAQLGVVDAAGRAGGGRDGDIDGVSDDGGRRGEGGFVLLP